jgi:hypothetical protein
MAHNKHKKELRRELANERQVSRTSYINDKGLDAYVQIRKALETNHPNGAKKEKSKLDKLITHLSKLKKK